MVEFELNKMTNECMDESPSGHYYVLARQTRPYQIPGAENSAILHILRS